MFKTPETRLPEGYRETLHIDIQKHKALAVGINVGAVVAFIAAFALVSIATGGGEAGLWTLILLLPSVVLYIMLHEAVHGLAFKAADPSLKVDYRFHGFAASASVAGTYFYKRHYLYSALAPFVLIGIPLFLIAVLSSPLWSGLATFVFAFHVSGCVGDLYVAAKLIRFPDHVLVEDYGVGMRFFEPSER